MAYILIKKQNGDHIRVMAEFEHTSAKDPESRRYLNRAALEEVKGRLDYNYVTDLSETPRIMED